MPRRVKIATREMGPLDLFLIYQTGDVWEAEWLPLQGTPLGQMIVTIEDEVVNHALRGWTKPLTTALGLPPYGVLRKLPVRNRTCEAKARCPAYDSAQCVPTGEKMPNCFQPAGMESDESRILAYEAVRMWREGVYLVAVKEPVDAHRNYPRAARR